MKTFSILCFMIIAAAGITAAQPVTDKRTMPHPAIEEKLFGKLRDGREVFSFTLTNASGTRATIINFGAAVVSLYVPDRNGKLADVVLGYDSLDGYVNSTTYFGVIVGRYGNRIAKGTFELEGNTYHLAHNDGENSLHGGVKGFGKVLWDAQPIEDSNNPALKLTYVSKDGEEGYPGTVTLSVTYTLTAQNELRIEYTGTTDEPTILNPTHHSYFNLTSDPTKTILDHELMIDADAITPVDAALIPTGKFLDVTNTPFDFRKLTKIGLRINANNEQLKFGRGYDHNFVLNHYNKSVRKVAEVYDASSGRVLEVFTDQPGIQFYSGNFLNGTVKGKNGVFYQHRTGLCLEAQCFPDSPNKPQWLPSVTLRPGETYRQTTSYKFSTK
ncbi:MAG: galactose mutarotase [Bacteroidota bacterium]|nr:galactose mutarotase [Bacteroidota bacterium]